MRIPFHMTELNNLNMNNFRWDGIKTIDNSDKVKEET